MKTQAWGWLVAGVMALGLNGFYQDGGFAWAHRAIAEIGHNTNAVLALASGRADQFLAEVQPVATRQETASCPLATALAKIQSRVTRMQTQLAQAQIAEVQIDGVRIDRVHAAQDAAWDRFQAMSDQEQAATARAEARRVRLQARMEEKRDWMRAMPAIRFASFETPCPHVRVNIPSVHVPVIDAPHVRLHEVHIPAVQIPQIDVPAVTVSAGPV